MRTLTPEITQGITRNIDLGAMMRDITTLNKENESIIKFAFGVIANPVVRNLTEEQANLFIVAEELGRNKDINFAVSLWQGSQQERNEIKIYFVWHIFNEMKRNKIDLIATLN